MCEPVASSGYELTKLCTMWGELGPLLSQGLEDELGGPLAGPPSVPRWKHFAGAPAPKRGVSDSTHLKSRVWLVFPHEVASCEMWVNRSSYQVHCFLSYVCLALWGRLGQLGR